MPDLALCLLSLSPQVSDFCLSSPTELLNKFNISLPRQGVCSQSFVYTEYENDLIIKKRNSSFQLFNLLFISKLNYPSPCCFSR